MLVAPYSREDVLIQVAATYQQSVDWDSFFLLPQHEDMAYGTHY